LSIGDGAIDIAAVHGMAATFRKPLNPAAQRLQRLTRRSKMTAKS
jgi:hypothetical protein